MTTGEHIATSFALDIYDRARSYVTVEPNTCASFRCGFLTARNWSAALVSEELSPTEAARVGSACHRLGYTKAYAFDIDHFDPERFQDIALDGENLSLVEETFVTPSYLIVEANERFMLVSDSDYYWSIAGSASFLEDIFGRPLEAVNRDFLDATRTYREGSSPIGRSLNRVIAETIGNAVSPT